MSRRAVIAVGIVLALALAAFVSPFASSDPDGLEAVAGRHGITEADAPVWSGAALSDYAMPGVRHAGVATGLAGVAGVLVVLVVGWAIGRLLRRRAA